jgi:hypothetical protein
MPCLSILQSYQLPINSFQHTLKINYLEIIIFLSLELYYTINNTYGALLKSPLVQTSCLLSTMDSLASKELWAYVLKYPV